MGMLINRRRHRHEADADAGTEDGQSVDPTDLKGEALDAALEEAGLPKTGKADEKRQRLADHLASTADADAGTEDGDDEDESDQDSEEA